MAGKVHGQRVMLLLLFLAVTVSVAVWIFQHNGFEWQRRVDLFGNPINREEFLRLQAENVMLKKFLGQTPGQIVVLGDVTVSGGAVGRLVWERATQSGFLYVKNLPDTGALYSLWVTDEAGQITHAGVFAADADGTVQSAFQTERPVFKPKFFFLAKGAAEKTVLLRGSL